MPASLPDGEVNERFRETVPPAVVTPDDKASESDWQNAAPEMKNAITPVAYLSIREYIVSRS